MKDILIFMKNILITLILALTIQIRGTILIFHEAIRVDKFVFIVDFTIINFEVNTEILNNLVKYLLTTRRTSIDVHNKRYIKVL